MSPFHCLRGSTILLFCSITLLNTTQAQTNSGVHANSSTELTGTPPSPTTPLTSSFSTVTTAPEIRNAPSSVSPSAAKVTASISMSPTESPTEFLFPVNGTEFNSSSQFSLQELLDDNDDEATGPCLTVNLTDGNSASSQSRYSLSGIGLSIAAILYSTENYPAAFATLLGTLGLSTFTEATNVTAIPVSGAKNYAVSFSMSNCSGKINSHQAFRLESAVSGWEGYGWLTVDGNPVSGGKPRCLTKNPVTDRLSVESCVYVERQGTRKVYDRQMWMMNKASKTLKNKADPSSKYCIKTDDNVCKTLWFGQIISSNCNVYPAGIRPANCTHQSSTTTFYPVMSSRRLSDLTQKSCIMISSRYSG